MVAITELSESEIERAVTKMEQWPIASVREVMELPVNERDLVGLLASELEAEPVDVDGYPLRKR